MITGGCVTHLSCWECSLQYKTIAHKQMPVFKNNLNPCSFWGHNSLIYHLLAFDVCETPVTEINKISVEATNYSYHLIVSHLYLTGTQAIGTMSCYKGAALVIWQTLNTWWESKCLLHLSNPLSHVSVHSLFTVRSYNWVLLALLDRSDFAPQTQTFGRLSFAWGRFYYKITKIFMEKDQYVL